VEGLKVVEKRDGVNVGLRLIGGTGEGRPEGLSQRKRETRKRLDKEISRDRGSFYPLKGFHGVASQLANSLLTGSQFSQLCISKGGEYLGEGGVV